MFIDFAARDLMEKNSIEHGCQFADTTGLVSRLLPPRYALVIPPLFKLLVYDGVDAPPHLHSNCTADPNREETGQM